MFDLDDEIFATHPDDECRQILKTKGQIVVKEMASKFGVSTLSRDLDVLIDLILKSSHVELVRYRARDPDYFVNSLKPFFLAPMLEGRLARISFLQLTYVAQFIGITRVYQPEEKGLLVKHLVEHPVVQAWKAGYDPMIIDS